MVQLMVQQTVQQLARKAAVLPLPDGAGFARTAVIAAMKITVLMALA
jgi:hypothetical protein